LPILGGRLDVLRIALAETVKTNSVVTLRL